MLTTVLVFMFMLTEMYTLLDRVRVNPHNEPYEIAI